MIYTTLNKIRAYNPCGQEVTEPLTGWRKLLNHLGKTEPDDDPLPLSVVLESNGLADALWTFRTVPEHSAVCRRLARVYALDVIHLWDAPDVVTRYLETGDDDIRDEAAAAARAAAARAEAWAAGAVAAEAWAAGAAARTAHEQTQSAQFLKCLDVGNNDEKSQ